MRYDWPNTVTYTGGILILQIYRNWCNLLTLLRDPVFIPWRSSLFTWPTLFPFTLHVALHKTGTSGPFGVKVRYEVLPKCCYTPVVASVFLAIWVAEITMEYSHRPEKACKYLDSKLHRRGAFSFASRTVVRILDWSSAFKNEWNSQVTVANDAKPF